MSTPYRHQYAHLIKTEITLHNHKHYLTRQNQSQMPHIIKSKPETENSMSVSFLVTNHFFFVSVSLEAFSHMAHLEHRIQDKGKRLAGFLILVLAAVPMILALFYQAHKYHTMGHESMVSRMKKYLSHHSGEHSGQGRKRQKPKMWRPKRRQLLGYKRTEY